MTENALTVQSSNYSIMPVMDIASAVQRRQAIIEFVKSLMVEGVHYGKIPGTDKPTLLKPGAEMLITLFGLAPRFVTEEATQDWTGENHNGEPFFNYRYRCQMWRGDLLVGEGIGSCNSWESKYRFRNAEPTCPQCGEAAIKKSKYPPRDNPRAKPGWYCYAKAGGCGLEFAHDDPAIIDQPRGKIANQNPQDLVNTIDKMSQKRSLVASTLITINASEFFNQDIEDMIFDGVYTENPVLTVQAQPQATETKAEPPAQKQPAPQKPVASRKPSTHKPTTPDSDETPPANLAEFAKWYAERHAYYKDNFHVIGTLKKEFNDNNIGVTFKNHAMSEVLAALELHATQAADAEFDELGGVEN